MKRTKKLVDTRLQLKCALAFACVAGLAVLVQALIVQYVMADLAARLPGEIRVAILGQLPSVLLKSTLLTVGLLLPLTVLVGVTLSFKLVGPLFAIKRFLRAVIAGQRPEDCRIRKDDEFQDLCQLVNQATEPVRRAGQVSEAGRKAA